MIDYDTPVTLKGTVVDNMEDFKGLFQFKQETGFQGTLEDYIRESGLPRLSVDFGEAGRGYGVSAAPVPESEAGKLKAGDTVECTIGQRIPGRRASISDLRIATP